MAENIKEAVEQAIENKFGHLLVPRQQHFEDHQKAQRLEHGDIDFIIESRKLVESIKDSFWKTLVKVLVVASLSVITGGIYAYFKYYNHKPH